MAEKVDIKEIQDAVRKKYADVSGTATGKFNYPTGKEGALLQGYDCAVIETMSGHLIDSFCGVGNPFALGAIDSGDVILDVGCGAGFDLMVASHLVGQNGKVYGIDLTPEMAQKADENLKQYRVLNYQIKVAGAESIPYGENTFDIVISNGVLNLSPLKEKSFREIHRVLKPSGRFQFADIVLKEGASVTRSSGLESWSD